MLEFYEELNKVNELFKVEGLEPYWYLLYGKLLVRDGKIQKAERILNEISLRLNDGNRNDTAAYSILKGEIQLAKGNPAEAIDLIKTGVNFRHDSYTLESLANYFYDTGDLDMAITKYKEIIEIKKSIGWEPQEYWIKAHYNIGKLYEKKGFYEQAIIYYQDFINIWKEADEDFTRAN